MNGPGTLRNCDEVGTLRLQRREHVLDTIKEFLSCVPCDQASGHFLLQPVIRLVHGQFRLGERILTEFEDLLFHALPDLGLDDAELIGSDADLDSGFPGGFVSVEPHHGGNVVHEIFEVVGQVNDGVVGGFKSSQGRNYGREEPTKKS